MYCADCQCVTGSCSDGRKEDAADPYLGSVSYVSVSVDREGIMTVSLNNLSLTETEELEIVLTDRKPVSVEGTILHGAMNAHNTFEEPDNIVEKEFRKFTLTERGISLEIPPSSVLVMRIR